MILKNVLVNIPFPIHLNLYHHEIMFCAFNLFLSSHCFLYHNAPRQQNQVTYIFYKSRRRPSSVTCLKAFNWADQDQSHRLPTPSLASASSHRLAHTHYSISQTSPSHVPVQVPECPSANSLGLQLCFSFKVFRNTEEEKNGLHT